MIRHLFLLFSLLLPFLVAPSKRRCISVSRFFSFDTTDFNRPTDSSRFAGRSGFSSFQGQVAWYLPSSNLSFTELSQSPLVIRTLWIICDSYSFYVPEIFEIRLCWNNCVNTSKHFCLCYVASVCKD